MRRIDVDVETVGLQWYSGELFLVQFGYDDGEVVILNHPEDREEIQRRLDDHEAEWWAWNSKFDAHFLLDTAGYRIAPMAQWHDAMVMAQLMDERWSVALKVRAERIFGKQASESEKALKAWLAEETKHRREAHKRARIDWLKENGIEPAGTLKKNDKYLLRQIEGVTAVPPFVPPNYSDVPQEIMLPYAANDIIQTRNLRNVYEPKMPPEVRRVYDEIEQPVLGVLFEAERRGLPIDREAAQRLQFQLTQNLDEIERRAKVLAGKTNFNPDSSDQVAEALKRRGADLSFVTRSEKTKKLSMDAENLETVDDELAVTVLRFRAEKKIHGTYISPMLNRTWEPSINAWKDPFIADDGRLHGNYRQVGARHGRMSSSDPNVQNFPRDDLRVRYLFRAEPGMKLVTADLSNIEMVLLAAFASSYGTTILDFIRNDGDMHSYTAKMAGLRGRQRVNGFESPRQQGKTLNYSVIYGAGTRSIRKAFRVSQAEARRILDGYHAAYPEVGALQQQIEWRLADRGYIQTPFGRRQRLEKSVRQEAYKFMNYLISGTAADILKIAAIKAHRDGIPLVGFVHDELVAHVPERDAPEVAHLLEKHMTDFPQFTEIVPFKADADIVDRWSDAKKMGYVPEHEQAWLERAAA